MVRTATVSKETVAGSAIVGGFVRVPVGALIRAWRICRSTPMKGGDFRVWLACHEMRARRCCPAEEGRTPAYGLDELIGLLGVTERTARGAVRRLVAAGLLEWSGSAIAFPEPADPVVDPDLEQTISRGTGWRTSVL